MRKSGIKVMWGLLGIMHPLMHIMLLCILLGTMGHACAIAITVLAANLLLVVGESSPWAFSFAACAVAMLLCAILRAVLRYGEQTCGHYIAFKVLAVIRDKVFGALRRLAPAKLQGHQRGKLISIITSDIELLEVFYAHTIAPICIAVLISLGMSVRIGQFSWVLGVLALASYAVVGVLIPLCAARQGRIRGQQNREQMGALGGHFLESLRGMRETLQYDASGTRAAEIQEKTLQLNQLQGEMKQQEGWVSAWSGLAVMALTLVMLGSGLALGLPFSTVLLTTVMLSASFGPTLALANLSASIGQTMAAGDRVLALLHETPETQDVVCGETPAFTGAAVQNLSFAYEKELVLQDVSAQFPVGKIVTVTGRSGSGKSTMLKLLMRFWAAQPNMVCVSGRDIGQIQTDHLRTMESYMIQETDLFQGSIRDNICIGKLDATQPQVEEAARKASLHDFVMTLPQGYDTHVGELGATLSSGERQRIGLARAFLHRAPLLLLDEPTSNLDSLNEGVVLGALREETEGQTVILVSHRKSTLAIADEAFAIDGGRRC